MSSSSDPGLYAPDPLGADFEQRILPQSPDYEGPVRAVLVRHRAQPATTRAVLYVHGFNDYFFQREMAEQYARCCRTNTPIMCATCRNISLTSTRRWPC